MAIDPSIPLMTKGIDGIQVLENGSKIAQIWQQDRANQELNRIYNESQGDVGKMLTLGQQSKMARYIVPQIQAQQAAQQKAALDLQKTQAEIANTNAQATERNANAGNTVFDTSNKKFGAIQGAISQAAMTGDKTVAMLALDGLRSAGVIKPEDYMSNVQLLNAMQPEDVKKWASGAVFGNTKDQGAYLFQTANNAADNAQSNINNQRTTNASIYSTDTAAATADKNRNQSQNNFEAEMKFKQQQQYFEQNKPSGYGVDAQGRKYAIVNGRGIYIKDQQGNYITEAPKGAGATTQAEEKTRMDRIDAILPEIEKILPNATSSYAGKGIDLLGSAVGISTSGQQATAQLKTLSGQLVSLMPKMSGPQSDKDVAMYKEMAGNLADDTLPIQTRLAALKTIRDLNNKYRSMSSTNQNQQQNPANQAKLKNILFGD